MFRRKLILGRIITAIITLAVIAAIYFLVPLLRFNKLAVFVNRNYSGDFTKAAWVTEEDLNSLKVMDDAVIQSAVLLKAHTKSSFKSLSYNTFVMDLEIKATAFASSDSDAGKEYSGAKRVTFKFDINKFRWYVYDISDIKVTENKQ